MSLANHFGIKVVLGVNIMNLSRNLELRFYKFTHLMYILANEIL